MKFTANNCLEHYTIINQVLEPHWGEIELIPGYNMRNTSRYQYNYDADNEDFNIKVEMKHDRISVISVIILGICTCVCDVDKICDGFEKCIKHIELIFLGTTSHETRFYRYPVFVLLQVLRVNLQNHNFHLSVKLNGFKIIYGGDKYNIYITIGDKELVNVDCNDKDRVNTITAISILIQKMIDGTAPESYYTVPITRIKSARS
jgi:hypothetical protein